MSVVVSKINAIVNILASNYRTELSAEEVYNRLPLEYQHNPRDPSKPINKDNMLKSIRRNLSHLAEKDGRVLAIKKGKYTITPAYRDSYLAENRNFGSGNRCQHGLSDVDLEQRILVSENTFNYELSDNAIGAIDKVKEAIKKQKKLKFSYHKKESGWTSRVVEPIGLVRHQGTFKLLALKESTGKREHLRVYSGAKLENLEVLVENNIYSQVSHEQAVAWINSGIDSYPLVDDIDDPTAKEYIEIELYKKAAFNFQDSRYKGCDEWNFTWIDPLERKAILSFKAFPSVGLVETFLGLGHYVKILKGDKFKLALNKNMSVGSI
jgi:hypothetical protein